MGDAAIGTIVMGNYAVDLDKCREQWNWNKAWHEAYGRPYPTSCRRSAGTPCTHLDTIKKFDGKVTDGQQVIDAMKG